MTRWWNNPLVQSPPPDCRSPLSPRLGVLTPVSGKLCPFITQRLINPTPIAFQQVDQMTMLYLKAPHPLSPRDSPPSMTGISHLSTGPSKRSSRRETQWHSRTSNHSSPPSIIRHPPTHRSPDPCRPAGTVTVDRLNPCMTHPCSCPRRCGGGPPAPRT